MSTILFHAVQVICLAVNAPGLIAIVISMCRLHDRDHDANDCEMQIDEIADSRPNCCCYCCSVKWQDDDDDDDCCWSLYDLHLVVVPNHTELPLQKQLPQLWRYALKHDWRMVRFERSGQFCGRDHPSFLRTATVRLHLQLLLSASVPKACGANDDRVDRSY